MTLFVFIKHAGCDEEGPWWRAGWKQVKSPLQQGGRQPCVHAPWRG